ncbi:Acyl-CoA N-acyltransferase [Apiospora sp. TS-2023a]
MVFIRPYQESDFEACAQINSAAPPSPPSLSTTPITAKLAPYIWTHQYTHLSPGTCHMLVDDESDSSDPSSSPGGQVVGYCIGTPEVYAFADRYPSYTTSILSTAVAPPPPLASPDEEDPEPFWIPDDTTLTPSGTTPLAAKKPNPAALIRLAHDPRKLLQLDSGPSGLPAQGWRATMHIDLLPAYQRRGWGRRLIDAYLRSVQASGEDYGKGAWIGIAPDNAGVVHFYEKVGFRLATPSSSEEGDNGAEDGIHMVIDIAKSS